MLHSVFHGLYDVTVITLHSIYDVTFINGILCICCYTNQFCMVCMAVHPSVCHGVILISIVWSIWCCSHHCYIVYVVLYSSVLYSIYGIKLIGVAWYIWHCIHLCYINQWLNTLKFIVEYAVRTLDPVRRTGSLGECRAYLCYSYPCSVSWPP